jgi:hypothetical protein
MIPSNKALMSNKVLSKLKAKPKTKIQILALADQKLAPDVPKLGQVGQKLANILSRRPKARA